MIEDLREVHLGEWEGGEYRRRMHERDPIAMQALMEERWDAIPGAETMDVARRARRRRASTRCSPRSAPAAPAPPSCTAA